MKDPFELFSFTVFVPFFILVWCACSLLLARLGGWSALAIKFRATQAPLGEKFTFCAAKIGRGQYVGIITAIKSQSGLYLSVIAPWRLGHPPILIPWAELKNARVSRRFWSWSRWVEVDVSAPSIIAMLLPEKLVRGKINLAENSGKR